jgi:hypothetical protein
MEQLLRNGTSEPLLHSSFIYAGDRLRPTMLPTPRIASRDIGLALGPVREQQHFDRIKLWSPQHP